MEPCAKYSIQTYNDQHKKTVALHGALNGLIDSSDRMRTRLIDLRLNICGAAKTYSFKS
jgi:hypothetical protein